MTCAHVTNRGRQCTKPPVPGEKLCSRHLPTPPLTSTDPEELLRTLMQCNDRRIQLRAVVCYTKLIQTKQRVCARCAERDERTKQVNDFCDRMTDAQRDELLAAVKRMKELELIARTQPLRENI